MRFGTYHAGWSIVWLALTVSALTGCGGGDDESAAAAPTQDATIGPPAAASVPAPPASAPPAPPTTGTRAATRLGQLRHSTRMAHRSLISLVIESGMAMHRAVTRGS